MFSQNSQSTFNFQSPESSFSSMDNIELFEGDDHPQVDEVTATRRNGVRYNSQRGFI